MKLDIHDIELADARILKMNFSSELNSILIISENSFRLSDKKRFGKTEIIISNWDELLAEKYVSNDEFVNVETIQIDFTKEIETFELIQEIIFDKTGNLFLNGWSKESGFWLTYNIKNYNCIVEADLIEDK